MVAADKAAGQVAGLAGSLYFQSAETLEFLNDKLITNSKSYNFVFSTRVKTVLV